MVKASQEVAKLALGYYISFTQYPPVPSFIFFFAREKVNGSLSLFPNPPTEKQRQ